MQKLITLEQAKKITKGRTPLVPIEYEEAINALAKCLTIDEAKYWSDKSDALAAWAKIYHDVDRDVDARRLKLHAYRRMGQIANELRPRGFSYGRSEKTGSHTFTGAKPGPITLLVEQGLKKSAAQAATSLAKLSENRFKAISSLTKPPTPLVASYPRFYDQDRAAWIQLRDKISLTLAVFRNHPTRDIFMSIDDRPLAKKRLRELTESLDELSRMLGD